MSVWLLVAQDNCCFYCGRNLLVRHDEPYSRKRHSFRVGRPSQGIPTVYGTLDHLCPAVDGFSLASNAVLACRPCNEHKGDRPPTIDELERARIMYERVGRRFAPRLRPCLRNAAQVMRDLDLQLA